MKNILHFAQLRKATVTEIAGLPKDSGNGYYDYDYYALPFSGLIGDKEEANIKGILHRKHYNPPFTSFGGIKSINVSKELRDQTGTIIYEVIYHRGD